jgi:hypothetical protein
MRPALILSMLLALPLPAFAAAQPVAEDCGWLVAQGDALISQPDDTLKPSDPKPLAAAPAKARAAYCLRDPMMTYVGDERVLKLGLPLVIRSGDREGVLEANPTVMFNYHRAGDRYLPGKAGGP